MSIKKIPKTNSSVRGLGHLDFKRVAEQGFGDPYNSYPHSMAWFQGHLYVGTTRACLAHRGRRRYEENPNLLGAGIWPVRIPKGLFDIDLRAQIWRYHPPTNTWEKVFTSPMVVGTHGEETPLTIALRTMVVFRSKNDPAPALYVPTMGSRYVPESVMLRSYDGINFEVVSEPGMGFSKPYRPRGVRATAVFNERIFTSPAVGQIKGESNVAGFMVIGVTDNPAGGEWKLACEPHFGDHNNLTVFEMEPFNGYLYAGTMNVNEGFQIWKTDAQGEPPYHWYKVMSCGGHRGQLNQIVLTLRAFGDHLYVGSAVQEGGYDQVNSIGPAAAEIIRINRDDSWDLLVGDPRITPDGLKVPLSGMGAGFGKPFAGYIWAMCGHEGWFYVGTLDWFVHLQFSDSKCWPKELRLSLPKRKMEQLLKEFSGFDLWRTRDGVRWIPVTQNGFDNPFNNGIRTMASSPHGLFIGATNPYGPEVAVERTAGWQYENNPRGGLEIWLGSRDHIAELSVDDSSAETDRFELQPVLIDGVENFRIEPFLEPFFNGSDYRCLGFWGRGMTDIKLACENLIEEVQAPISDKSGRIADLGCGLGASTAYLRKHYSVDRITGVTFDREQLEHCRNKVTDVEIRFGKPSRLNLPRQGYDCVTWIKGIDQPPTSAALLRETLRALKPGGIISCFDVLPVKVEKSNRRSLFGSDLMTREEYKRALAKLGFEDIQINDVTKQCLDGFRVYRARYLDIKSLLGVFDADILKKINAFFLDIEKYPACCLLIAARKSCSKK